MSHDPPFSVVLGGEETGYTENAQELPEGNANSSPELEKLRAELRTREAEILDLRRRLQGLTPPPTPAGSAFQRKPSGPSTRPLSIVIPMMGAGWEFAEAGFRMPKPLVNVVGRPVLLWLLDNLSIARQDNLFLAVPVAMNKQFGLEKLLSRELPHVKVKVVTLAFETRGWVETMLAVVRQMTAKERSQMLVSLDCATIYHGIDLLERCRQANDIEGASVYFDVEGTSTVAATGSAPTQFSYLKLSGSGHILEVKEKSVISTYANAGAYIFKKTEDFRLAAESLLEDPDALQGGLYASSLMAWMIGQGKKFEGIRVDYTQIAIVSHPTQLQSFISKVSSEEVKMNRKMRFCFDLEGTLVTQSHGTLGECAPIQEAIAILSELHRAGHTIIITTSRGMNLNGGVDMAVAKEGHATFELLAKFGIPYDELHFGKPYADVYVDSHALSSHGDLKRDLGWAIEQSVDGALDGAIDARSFNLVRAAGKENVMKSSTPDVLKGECHWYRSIPPQLSQYFPEPLEVTDGDASKDDAVSSIKMTKVAGVTFSHLSTARLLMPVWVRRLMQVLHRIHSQEPPADSPAAKEPRATVTQMCTNYATKIKKRTAANIALYDSLAEELGLDTRRMAEAIISFLEDFETSERPQHAFYIHGDPVFSNVIRTNDEGIVLIDMRGELGKWITTQGDVHYDLSKVYQSLCGYDFMLLDQALDEPASECFDGLRAAFWDEVRTLYPSVQHRHVRLLTAAHFFTIVPLHEVRSRMVRYLRTSHSMLHVEGLMEH